MGIAAEILGRVYALGRELDKATTIKKSFPHPVISVGNICSGGRGKTPMVIELIRGLRERDLDPVVLTRGYGRKEKGGIVLGYTNTEFVKSGEKRPTQSLSGAQLADLVGDEALEIFVKTGAKIIVGAKRFKNARWWLKRKGGVTSNVVFLLDDGFQHWALERDLDIVLYNEFDLKDSLLPLGRLREGTEALDRADLPLKLGQDVQKFSILPENLWNNERALHVTTRAEGEASYSGTKELASLPALHLKDHTNREALLKAIHESEASEIVVGYKEAVKLMPLHLLWQYRGKAFSRSDVIEGKRLFVYGLQLRVHAEDLWLKIDYMLSERYEGWD